MGKDTMNSICICQTRRKSKYPTYFEWIQLLVTFSVPVAIALYTFLQNNNDQVIALANREKDLEIARYQRVQDLQIADDQQRANILTVYESFLVSHLNRYGMTLDGSSSARFIARLKTLTTVNQLDPIRKSFLIQSLFEAKLIVNEYNTTNPYGSGIISLEDGDLSGISFNNRALKYLSLPNSNLNGAVFAFVVLSCVNFYHAILINADFYYASVLALKYTCFLNSNYTIFVEAKLTGANFFKAAFIATDFTGAFLEYANISHFQCINCLFSNTNMYRADLSFSMISGNSSFKTTNLTETVLVSVIFRSTKFTSTKFIQNQAINIEFEKCSFTSTSFSNCVLQQASIVKSNFSETNFTDVNLSKSILTNVNFIDITMYYTNLSSTIFNQCTFINVNFNDAIVQNASFLNCTFQNSLITNKGASFTGSVFS